MGAPRLPGMGAMGWVQQMQQYQQQLAQHQFQESTQGAPALVPPQLPLPHGLPLPGQPQHQRPSVLQHVGAQQAQQVPMLRPPAQLLQQHQQHQPLQLQQQQLQQQMQAAVASSQPAAEEAPPPPQVSEAEREQQLAQQQAREAAELRRQVENSEGYFEPQQPLGYVINADNGGRYTIIDKKALGVGVFSVVWPCADAENKLVAMKVIRWQDHFRRYADKEVLIMRRVKELAENDREGSAQVAMLRDHFVHKIGEVEHLCMAFEKLESNLRTAGKQPLDKVLKFSKQILVGLRYLHDICGLVHCDVKPDNLLLRWDGLSVKLCDFGTARTSPEVQTIDELQPLFYRAPEVFMGATRGRKIDLWSAGCTMYELTVGRILFRSCTTHREVVEKIMQLCGPIPASVREQGRLTRAYFSSRGFHPEVGGPVDADTFYKKTGFLSTLMGSVDFGKEDAKSAHDLAQAQLSKLIGRTTVIGAAQKKKKKGDDVTMSEQRVRQLADLIISCMDVDPTQRLSAAQAVDHEVFKAVELPPAADLQEAPPLPEEAPPPLPPQASPPAPAPVSQS